MADRGRGRRGGGNPGRGGREPAHPGRGGRGGRGDAHMAVSLSAGPPLQAVSSMSREFERKLQVGQSSEPLVIAPTPQVNPETDKPHELAPASSKAVRLPARPGYGKFGRKTVVMANHFLVTVANRDLHHYDVSISPEVTSKKVCRDIMTQLVVCFRASHLGGRMLAYDGSKSVYTAGKLPFTSKEFVVKLERDSRKEREFKVNIKFASKADLHHLQQFLKGAQLDSPQETIQCLDVVLREKPSNDYTVVGRSFFHPSLGGQGELGNGLEYWKGFYQSLRPTQMGLSLNIDMSARAFFEPLDVTMYVQKYLNLRDIRGPLSDQDRVKVKKILKGVRVQVHHSKNVRRYKISDVTKDPMHQLMFTVDASGTKSMISVVDYFRQTYNIALKYPQLPALQAGSDTKPIYLPMELCQILPGQRYSRKLNEKQVTELLRATCQRPRVRQDSIKNMLTTNAYNSDSLVHDEFGISVSANLTSVEARVLPPPALRYHESGRESRIEPRVGQWNMINKKMVNGGRVDGWTGVCFSRHVDEHRFCSELIGMCKEKGMQFNPNPLVPVRSSPPNQIDKVLRAIAAESSRQGGNLQLLIVILPDMTGSYDMIKRVCETELGIVSQCCQPRQAGKFSKQYMENVALKINVKVGGTNSLLELARVNGHPFLCDRPTIVFGADVTHPSPGEDSSPSIAAVVASVDWPQVSTYRALVSSQGPREEMIQDLYRLNEDPKKGTSPSGMIRDHLIHFYKRTNQKPDRILFYRDGVSEGQFSQVLLHEVDAIRKACTSIQENYLPRITFVVVQKRHHTRLFPANHDDRNSTDRSGNILPGTIVDTSICHPNEFDFYLCSHAGIQGTSRPTHYHVLYDENKFSADAMQMLTNNLCYTYARCTRSVSIVPPAYYAHLAAARARCYISDRVFDSSSSDRGAPAGATRGRNAVKLPNVAPNVQAVMFYC